MDEESSIYINWDGSSSGMAKSNIEALQDYLSTNHLAHTLTETACGVILTLTHPVDMDGLAQHINTTNMFPLSKPHAPTSYRQGVFVQGVPWSLPLEEVEAALLRQGISGARVERKRQYVRVEVTSPEHYSSLLKHGLEFFNVTRFAAVPDRGTRNSVNWNDRTSNLTNDPHHILQCFRCQGWWHTAARCRYKIRCVRCGAQHSVSDCLQPRSEPICCHCGGPHSAAHKQCPVRLSLLNALPISFTLSTDSPNPRNRYDDVI